MLELVPVDGSKPGYEVYANMPSPRIIKTHFALSVHKGLLDSGCKVTHFQLFVSKYLIALSFMCADK